MKSLYLILLSLILFACSGNDQPSEVPPFEDRDISLEEKMKIAISEAYIAQIGLPDSTLQFLLSYYESRSFSPRWINDSTLTETGLKLKNILEKPYIVGIPEGRTIQVSTENYIQDEINITLSLAQVMYDLEHGLIDYETKKATPRNFISPGRFDALATFDKNEDLRHQFIKYGPQDSTYQALGRGLVSMLDTYPLDTSTFEVKSIKYDTTAAIEKARVALVSKGYLKDGIMDSVGIAAGLTTFQEDNGLKPDAVIGKYTSQALNESTYHKVERIILAMDKIRVREKRPEKYIYINIPEYKLRLYVNDSLKSAHNIVVGKYENQTPELTSRLKKIVVYPYWNVPYSISSKEILPAVKRNTGYLEKHNYKILKNGEEVDPYTVNWKSIRQNAFPYKVRQEPGARNSLGVIKFDFYNEHSVYFHDTPSKSLFGVDVRAYSHGCMRTQYPVELARRVLEFDSLSPRRVNVMRPDSLDSLIDLGRDTSSVFNYQIKLIEPIPIFIEYMSVTRDENDEMVVYLDIYGRDEEYLELLRH